MWTANKKCTQSENKNHFSTNHTIDNMGCVCCKSLTEVERQEAILDKIKKIEMDLPNFSHSWQWEYYLDALHGKF